MSRRALLGRAAVGGAVAWTMPVITSLNDPVAAAVGSLGCPAVFCWDSGTAEGWVIDNASGPGKKPGLWNINSSRSVSGSYSLHYGRGSGSNYNINGRHSGTATSPSSTLPSTGPMNLEFSVWREIETANGFEDKLDGVIMPSGDVVYSRFADGGTNGQWEQVSIDLSVYAGTTIQVMFTFDTGDGANNNFEGVYIDDVSIPCATAPDPGAPVAEAGADGFFPAWAPELTEAEQAERFLAERVVGG